MQSITPWNSLGIGLESLPAVAAWNRREVQIFAIRQDGDVWHRYWDGERWHLWESLGGKFVGQPAASARDEDRIDVFAVGRDGRVRHRYWDVKEWLPWEPIEDAPSNARGVSCAWNGRHLELFVESSEGELWHTTLKA